MARRPIRWILLFVSCKANILGLTMIRVSGPNRDDCKGPNSYPRGQHLKTDHEAMSRINGPDELEELDIKEKSCAVYYGIAVCQYFSEFLSKLFKNVVTATPSKRPARLSTISTEVTSGTV
jgi:hypothetical protein